MLNVHPIEHCYYFWEADAGRSPVTGAADEHPHSLPLTVYTYTYDPTARVRYGDIEITILAWPSRGGMIALDGAEAIDFDFLGLDPTDPPSKRLDDQVAEDAFCQRLLRLGAKWWDSEERYLAVGDSESAANGDRTRDHSYEQITVAQPTIREKRFVKVGYPSTGGLWFAEFDPAIAGVDEEDNSMSYEQAIVRLKLARTMDERCAIMRD